MGFLTEAVAWGVILQIVVVLGVLALIALVVYLRHRERMTGWTASQNAPGADGAPPYSPRVAGHSPLESALGLVGVGLALLVGLGTLGVGVWLVAGLIVLFIGLVRVGLIAWGLEPAGPWPVPISQLVRRGLYTTAIGAALTLGLGTLGMGVWLLGGLIPLGIGLSRLATALLATRGWVETQNP
ncbi:MAG: hypothetical protein M0Z54_04465 [Thermaerobacter sp.]|nr:hypothetical protein [Thermaerobacter sp.]